MRFLIVGAGGIGAYYGARLLASGHDVVFVARGSHQDIMRKKGLRVIHPEFVFNQTVVAVGLKEIIEEYQSEAFDLIIMAAKSGGTALILSYLSDWLSLSDTPVMSLQNGVQNEELIEQHVGRKRTIGGLAVRIGTHILEPGVIEAKGPEQVVIGAWPNQSKNPALQQKLEDLIQCFSAASIPATLSANIQYELWRKLLINNGVNPLSALTGLTTGELTSHPVYSETVLHLMQEAAVAAKADGISLDQRDVEEMYTVISRNESIKTSMLVDREKGRPLEINDISGVVINRCHQLGEEAPYTTLIYTLLTQEPFIKYH